MPRMDQVIGQAVATAFAVAAVGRFLLASDFGPVLVGCPIKGNISKSTGERISHVP